RRCCRNTCTRGQSACYSRPVRSLCSGISLVWTRTAQPTTIHPADGCPLITAGCLSLTGARRNQDILRFRVGGGYRGVRSGEAAGGEECVGSPRAAKWFASFFARVAVSKLDIFF